jgi:hypothetical protein
MKFACGLTPPMDGTEFIRGLTSIYTGVLIARSAPGLMPTLQQTPCAAKNVTTAVQNPALVHRVVPLSCWHDLLHQTITENPQRIWNEQH